LAKIVYCVCDGNEVHGGTDGPGVRQPAGAHVKLMGKVPLLDVWVGKLVTEVPVH
jgi:hypothetical protein